MQLKIIDRKQSLGESAEAASSFVGSRAGLNPLSPGWCTHSLVSYATQLRYCRIMPFSFTMPDETVETRRPWRGSPCPAIHGRAFLCVVCIIRQYLGSFVIRSCEKVCPQPVSRDEAPHAVTKYSPGNYFFEKI